ncbi:MAG: peptidoglycan editing factor PgeF [Gammaproteobacteria bacterium]|nr:peptidoglycan editing factor PgeF [Gammaproteobacteria bacterium]
MAKLNRTTESLFFTPDWPAPARVRAAVSRRAGGASGAGYASLNLGAHVGDAAEAVTENRRRLAEALALPEPPLWLNQVHGVAVHRHAGATEIPPEADASWTETPGRVCAVLTADCLPVLFCDKSGSRVAAAHAGWRGLCAGVLEASVAALDVPAGEILAWLGPAIGSSAFEVGEEVRAAFVDRDAGAAEAFRASPQGRWLADLYVLARRRLRAAGVEAIHGGGRCTYSETDEFFSYRRDRGTGRFGSLIWLEADGA